MKLLARLILTSIGVVVLALGGWATWILVEYPKVPEPFPITHAAPSPEKVARGSYLFNNVARCVDCHSTRDWTKYAAPVVKGTEGRGGEAFTHALMGVPGDFYARNITPTALADWTDQEIARAITTGVNKHGEALYPVMPYRNYGELDAGDVEALVAYIRTLQPQPNEVPDRSFHFPMQIVVRTLPRPARFAARPDPQDKVAYGGYLVRAAGCAECHATRDADGNAVPGMEFAGGMEFRFTQGGLVRAPNITPDADTGLGTWSEQQFVTRFKIWERAPERVLPAAQRRNNTVMPWRELGGMTRDDLAAVYAFLRTQKPVIHRVRKRDLASVASNR
jgi:mono/diheme cytochrome c family protein